MKNTSPKKEEARFDRKKAERIWKKVATKESSLTLLRNLKSEKIGTRNVENFIIELRGEKTSKPKGTVCPGGFPRAKTNKTK